MEPAMSRRVRRRNARVGLALSAIALVLGAIALVSIGPFAQFIVFALALGVPLAIVGRALGARRTGALALLTIVAALAVNPLLVEFRAAEIVALAFGLALLAVAGWMLTGYRRERRAAAATPAR
jgi:hypothetical protein